MAFVAPRSVRTISICDAAIPWRTNFSSRTLGSGVDEDHRLLTHEDFVAVTVTVYDEAETGCRASLRVTGAAGSKEPRKNGEGTGTAVITRPKTQTKRPSMFRVLLLNDDYTPMEFVIAVLRKYFNKGPDEATRIMLHVHHHGVGECGVFTYEVAETKVTQVMDFARKHQHPLQCIMEKK
jgi:ATP-dependent Clp protease adaptor protein ClpS